MSGCSDRPAMSRFFFSVRRHGETIPDEEGDELPDLDAARALAAETVRDMMRLPHLYGEPREWRKNAFIISDDTGATLLVLPYEDLMD